jgi:IS5 family transposase
MSDHRGAAMMLPALPPARELLADRGYDSNRFRAGLTTRGITPCIPSTKSRNIPLPYDKVLYANAIASRTCSAASRTGAASRPATTDAPTPSSRPFASQQPSPSGSHNES